MPNPWGGPFGKPRIPQEWPPQEAGDSVYEVDKSGHTSIPGVADMVEAGPGYPSPYGRTGPWNPNSPSYPASRDRAGKDSTIPTPDNPSPWGMTGINRWKTTEPPVTGLPEGSRGPWNPQYKIPGYDPSKSVTVTANMTDDQRNAANMFNYLNTAIPYLAPADLATTLAQMAQSATSLGPEYAEYAKSLQSGYGSGTSWASNDTYGGSKWRLTQARNGLAASMVNDSATGLPDADEASIIGLLDALIQLMPEQGQPASRSQITAYNNMAQDLMANVPSDYQGILENIIFPKTDVPGLNLNYGSSSGARSTYGNSGGSRSYGYVNPRYT